MLRDATVQPMLPVKDLDAATRFYEDTLGFERVGGESGVAATYRSGSSTLCVYRSEFAGTNKGTAALWEVDDVEGTAKELKGRGVAFEKYDLNLTMIQSRPTKLTPWEYVFFVDVIGHVDAPGDGPLQRALKAFQERCLFVRVLGSYPEADIEGKTGPT